jgi:hypothetical protein
MTANKTQELDAARNSYRNERIPPPTLKVMDNTTWNWERREGAA